MKCDRILPLLDELAAGALPLTDEAAVLRHLDNCPPCLAAYDQVQALFTDLAEALGMEPQLPAGLDGPLGERLLAQLPALPGREDPLHGTERARRRARFGVSLIGLGGALVAGLWLLAAQATPNWLSRSLVLAVGAFGRAALAVVSEVAFAFTLTLKGAGLVLRDLDPAAAGLAALALALGALVLALRSPGSRWQQ